MDGSHKRHECFRLARPRPRSQLAARLRRRRRGARRHRRGKAPLPDAARDQRRAEASHGGDRRPLFARQGRGLALTTRGERLLASARPHLEALVAAATSAPAFDPAASERTVRLGLSDVSETWLLPPLLRVLAREAPRMRFVVVPVQFRTVARELASGAIDLAVTIADELPAGIRRRPLFFGGFSCLYDPKHARVGKRLTRKTYFAHQHVIVSYNADLRGLVEDLTHARRDVRISVPSFQGIGALVEGTALLATVPTMVGRLALRHHPRLRLARFPLPLPGASMELFWRSALDDDESVCFVMDHVVRIAKTVFDAI